MCGALALAEVAALFPNAGGMYVYLREAYGPLTGFLYGWLYLFVIPAGAGAIALVFAEYLGRLLLLSAGQIRAVAILVIILLAAAQYRSVRFGAAIQNVSTAAKVLAILALTAAAFLLGRARRRSVGRRHAFRGPELERLRARRRHGALGVQRLAGRDLPLG